MPDFADVCYECGTNDEEDKILICDSCDFKTCHFYCDGLPKLPSEEQAWFCKFCIDSDREYRNERRM